MGFAYFCYKFRLTWYDALAIEVMMEKLDVHFTLEGACKDRWIPMDEQHRGVLCL